MSTKIQIGVMGCSAFAQRAMLPAIEKCPSVELVAIGSRNLNKAAGFCEKFGGVPTDYAGLVSSPEIDAIYMPLPTGLHEEWVHKALDAGKHLLVEKSLAVDFLSASEMIAKARANNLLLLENFLFLRHSQFAWIREQLACGSIGDLKFFRAAFTIPPLDPDNFRYNTALGGGALLDVGAYMVKSSLALLGDDLQLLTSTIEHDEARHMDIRGSATLRNPAGVIAQALWAFDTHYQCTWEFIGTKGRILCERALTPPPGFSPPVHVENGTEKQQLKLKPDNHYENQWNFFAKAIHSPESAQAILDETETQARLLDAVKKMAEQNL